MSTGMGLLEIAENARLGAVKAWRTATAYSSRRVTETRRRVRVFAGRSPRRIRLILAKSQNRALNLWYQVAGWCQRHRAKLGLGFLMALAVASVLLVPPLQRAIGPSFTDDRLAALRSLLVEVGGSLIGATAIVFSVVMLAVQLNFARIPHGLFRKLSSDVTLLACFAATFLLGAGVGVASMIPDKSFVAAAIVASTWFASLSLVLFFLAYLRALDLISPAKQLEFVMRDVQRSMHKWDRWATRSAPLLERRPNPAAKRDMSRALFFKAQPQWEQVPRRALTYVISFARTNAEQGDYEISGAALSGLVGISRAYIATRGRTFFADNPIFHNPLSSEGFISDVLEQLRQLAQVAQGRKDEQQFIQVMAAMERLAEVYSQIDYGQDFGVELHHTQLAAGYLTRALEGALGTFGADVAMEGLRLMGRSGLVVLGSRRALGVGTIADHIGAIGLTGLRPGYEPVTSTAVEQLASLAFELLRSGERDVDHAAKDVRGAIGLVARGVLQTADSTFGSGHSRHMAAYYSLTSERTFGNRLAALINAVVQRPKGDEDAARIIAHLEEWADGLFRTEKELLLAAVEKRSFLALDLIAWIGHVTQVLVVAANAPAASDHNKEQLLKHAAWLICVLDWLPDDKEAVTYLENFHVTEQLFEAAMWARARGAEDVAEGARDSLVHWAFKAGQHQTGWASLETALKALALMAAWEEGSDWPAWLLNEVKARLAKNTIPEERRERAARDLRREARSHGRGDFAISALDQALGRVHRGRFETLMTGLADLLAPPDAPKAAPAAA